MYMYMCYQIAELCSCGLLVLTLNLDCKITILYTHLPSIMRLTFLSDTPILIAY